MGFGISYSNALWRSLQWLNGIPGPFTSQFAELFSMEIFWLLQQQLIRNTVFLGQEGEQWMPYRPPTIENYPP